MNDETKVNAIKKNIHKKKFILDDLKFLNYFLIKLKFCKKNFIIKFYLL